MEHDGRKLEYIEVTVEDIATANRLAGEVLGRSLDELPPQTRRLLGRLVELVATECEEQGLDRSQVRFSRRDVREATGWGEIVDLHYTHVGRYERGTSRPSADALQRLADALGVSADYLMQGTVEAAAHARFEDRDLLR